MRVGTGEFLDSYGKGFTFMSTNDIALLFDAAFIEGQLPIHLRSNSDYLARYRDDPALWKYSPHTLFNSHRYLRQNPDVALAGINPLYHFICGGGAEGRSPTPLFDPIFYRNTYLQGSTIINPLIHYLREGAVQGNLPYLGFDYDLYRNLTGTALNNDEILADLSKKYSERSHQKFIRRFIQTALQSCDRIKGSTKNNTLHKDHNPSDKRPCSVVIPVKNSVHWALRALDSVLLEENLSLVDQILFVDDGTNPEELEILNCTVARIRQEIAPCVIEIRQNTGNRGFAGACNFGAAATTAPYILFLNSDCLLAPRTIEKLLNAFKRDKEIGLVCPLSNNAANATVPLLPGASFIQMDSLLEQAAQSLHDINPEICTIVGHCLMVSRQCYVELDGMDEGWGLGYGEESDFHLRARAAGFLGVSACDSYVYHFGGGTFRNEETREKLQFENHRKFLSMWGDAFLTFYQTVKVCSPPEIIEEESLRPNLKLECDVLFILPGLTKGVGGVQVVIDLCNHLIMRGIDARTVILGSFDETILEKYNEPIYFRPLHSPSERHLLTEIALKPRVTVATLFATVPAAFKFASASSSTLVNFVQGYEFYFDGGQHFEAVRDSYHLATSSITTSAWLTDGVKRHAPNVAVTQLQLGIDHALFYPPSSANRMQRNVPRLGMVIRSAPDKGQFVLREICDLTLKYYEHLNLTIFIPDDYTFTSAWCAKKETTVVRLPTDRTIISRHLREVDIFVDASLHEGYGLFPLEAMACGATVIASDSGGVHDFLSDNENGYIISAVNKPEAYIEKISLLLNEPQKMRQLQTQAIQRAQTFGEQKLFDKYAAFFRSL